MTAHTADELAPLDCLETVRRLWDYLDHELSADETRAVDAHLALCDRCPPHFVFEHAFLAAVRAARTERGASARLRDRVRAILELDTGNASSNGENV